MQSCKICSGKLREQDPLRYLHGRNHLFSNSVHNSFQKLEVYTLSLEWALKNKKHVHFKPLLPSWLWAQQGWAHHIPRRASEGWQGDDVGGKVLSCGSKVKGPSECEVIGGQLHFLPLQWWVRENQTNTLPTKSHLIQIVSPLPISLCHLAKQPFQKPSATGSLVAFLLICPAACH